MFLLPAIVVGVAFALALGGRPSRLLDVKLRHSWTVVAAFVLQLVLFPPIALDLSDLAVDGLHIASYALLVFFGIANVRNLALLPLFVGMSLNAVAIAAFPTPIPASLAYDITFARMPPISNGATIDSPKPGTTPARRTTEA